MNKLNREKLHGVLGTMIFHIVLLAVLLLVVMEKPQQQEESGLSVVMGNVPDALGDAFEYTEVAAAPRTDTYETPAASSASEADEAVITQRDEPTVQMPEATNANKKQENKKTKEQLEIEQKQREAEQAKREAERLARIANERIAGAFGKGATMAQQGNNGSREGHVGSTEGNDVTGVTTGTGGYGTFDLGGRTLRGNGKLPHPEYRVQDEGRVVVTITVNPEGRVVAAEINGRTNTANKALRDAAIRAAKQAVFNSIDGLNNQTGTITYYFTLR